MLTAETAGPERLVCLAHVAGIRWQCQDSNPSSPTPGSMHYHTRGRGVLRKVLQEFG